MSRLIAIEYYAKKYINLKDKVLNSDITAIDNVSSVINACRLKFINIRFEIMDADDIKFEGRPFDIILIGNVFEHLDNPINVLKKAKNVLKPEGIIIISTPNRYRLQNTIRILTGRPVGISEGHVTEYSIGQVIEMARYCGLNLAEGVFPGFNYMKKGILWRAGYYISKTILSFYLFLTGSRHNLNPVAFYILKVAS